MTGGRDSGLPRLTRTPWLSCFRLVASLSACFAFAAASALGMERGEPGGSSEEEMDFDTLNKMSLEELLNVVTPMKTEQRIEEAPSIIDVITEKEIREYGYRSVAEALSHVAGVYVRNDLIHPNVSMRGVDSGLRAWSREIKVMINSQPISYRGDTSNWLGPGLIPMQAISQIEVIRGPGSALYGANAFLGVVNIITKKSEPGFRVVLEGNAGAMFRPCSSTSEAVSIDGGTYDLCNSTPSSLKPLGSGSVSATQQIELGKGLRLEYLLAGGLNYEDRSGLLLPATGPHFSKTPPRFFQGPSSDIASRNDTDTSGSVFGSVKLGHQKWGSLALEGLFNQFETYGEFTDWSVLTHNNRVSMRNWYCKLSYSNSLADNSLDLSLSYALAGGGYTKRNHLEIERESDFWVRKDGGYLGHDIALESRWLISKEKSVSLTAGITLSIDLQDLPSIYAVEGDEASGTTTEVPSYLLGEKTFVDTTALVQFFAKPLDNTGIIAGLSYDWQNVYARSCSTGSCPGLNPRLGIVQTIIKSEDYDLYAKALYGTSFKAPPAELIYGTPYVLTGIRGNNDLQPEKASTAELVVGGRFFGLSLLVDGFYTKIQKRIEYVQSGNFIEAMNSGEADTMGIEASASVHHKTARHGVSAYANISWQRTKTESCLLNDEIECGKLAEFNYLFPSVITNGGVEYRFKPWHLGLGLSGTYIGERWASQSNRLENLPDNAQSGSDFKAYKLSSYVLLNLRILVSDINLLGNRKSAISLTANNLLNSGIVEPGFNGIDTPGLGRTLILSIRQEL